MVLRIVIGIFMVLHGLVHLLYFGQSRRLFELQPGMIWPDGSWAFARLLGEEGAATGTSCLSAVIGFAAGGTACSWGGPGGGRWSCFAF